MRKLIVFLMRTVTQYIGCYISAQMNFLQNFLCRGFLQLAPKLNSSTGSLGFCTSCPVLKTRSSVASPFIFPSRPRVELLNSSGRRTVAVMVTSLSRTSTPAPDGNITVTLVGVGENTNTPGGDLARKGTETLLRCEAAFH